MKAIILSSIFIVLLAACGNEPNNQSVEEKQIEGVTANDWEVEIKKYPDSFLLKENLIQFYRDSGYLDKAIQAAHLFLTTAPSNPRLHHILGYLYFENADTLNAIRGFEKSYLLSPNKEDLILMSQLSAMKGMEMAKLTSDTLLLSSDPYFKKQGAFIAGLYHQSKKEYHEALRYFDMCLQSDFTFMEAYAEKTNILLILGETAAAAETIQKAVTLQNNFTQGYLLLGRCREKLQQKDKAIEAYRRALLYQPDSEEAMEGLGRCEE